MKTIWQKSTDDQTATWFWNFTTTVDRTFDQQLIPYEILSNLAHTQILRFNQLITDDEHKQLRAELIRLWENQENLALSDDDEDVHSFLEKHLTASLGDLGKRIHTMRSRNDLILADTRLWGKYQVLQIAERISTLIQLLIDKAEAEKTWFPGLTHTQLAMPQCSDTFYGGYAELLLRVANGLEWAWRRLDVLPMGSAAGYGTPYFDVQTTIYAELLGFKTIYSSVSYNQLSRGLEEQASLSVLDEVMQVINRLASDLIFMASDINGWVSADSSQVSGSSIMPQKKNPDAWELIRSETHRFAGALSELRGITTNMSSGYHRDLQRVKHVFMSALFHADYMLEVVLQALPGIEFNSEKCKAALKPELFATHVANKLTIEGMPFRDAYKKAAATYKDAEFSESDLQLSYVYKGTPGNAQLEQVKSMLSAYRQDVGKRKQYFTQAVESLVNK
ncbi:hypothetical protein EP331_14215 [bacterium]|nr:MAG: hypothetical protein EP331_14215 [bacterium]